MGKDFEVIVKEKSEKGKEFMKVFGTTIVKIKSPIPEYILTPDKEKVLAYFLDLDLITKEQRENLIKHLSEKFNEPIDFVRENLDDIGVPILKSGCSLVIENPQKWF